MDRNALATWRLYYPDHGIEPEDPANSDPEEPAHCLQQFGFSSKKGAKCLCNTKTHVMQSSICRC